jgi:hypothetical protein
VQPGWLWVWMAWAGPLSEDYGYLETGARMQGILRKGENVHCWNNLTPPPMDEDSDY